MNEWGGVECSARILLAKSASLPGGCVREPTNPPTHPLAAPTHPPTRCTHSPLEPMTMKVASVGVKSTRPPSSSSCRRCAWVLFSFAACEGPTKGSAAKGSPLKKECGNGLLSKKGCSKVVLLCFDWWGTPSLPQLLAPHPSAPTLARMSSSETCGGPVQRARCCSTPRLMMRPQRGHSPSIIKSASSEPSSTSGGTCPASTHSLCVQKAKGERRRGKKVRWVYSGQE